MSIGKDIYGGIGFDIDIDIGLFRERVKREV